jgi:NhaP-type Na+/H+ or K+/H+ antiporter
MPLSIAAAALIGYWVLGLAPAAAMLLGAVMAPTDPVLASDVQVEGPRSGDEHEVRFALTSEAGLNDGLAFPFTYAAIAMSTVGASPGGWIGDWLLTDVLYRLGVGALAGIVLGRGLAFVVFRWARRTPLRETEGLIALAGTFMVYGATELVHGYGFLAVFIAAYVLRDHEQNHEFHTVLHVFADQIERLLSAVILLLFGGAIASGALTPFDWRTVVFAAALLFVIRPIAGVLGVLGSEARHRDRLAIAFFGIRGIGSLYYLFYALNADAGFRSDADVLWAAVSLTILVSIVLHGVAASPVIRRIEG